MVRVLICDDQAVVREGLAAIRCPGLQDDGPALRALGDIERPAGLEPSPRMVEVEHLLRVGVGGISQCC